MSADGTSTPANGDIVSAKAEADGTIRVESYVDGELHTHVFDREGYRDASGVYHAPSDAPPAPADPSVPHYEGEILSAYAQPDGSVHVEAVVNGEIQASVHAAEGYIHEAASDTGPVPTEVIHYAADGSGDPIATYRDEDGLHTVRFGEEPIRHLPDPEPTPVVLSAADELDGLVHAMAQPSAHDAVPAGDAAAPLPGEVMSSRTDADGDLVTTIHQPDGTTLTITNIELPVHHAEPPVPTLVEFEVTAGAAGHGADAPVVDAYGDHSHAYDTHDTDYAPHADVTPAHDTGAAASDASHASAATAHSEGSDASE